MADIGGTAFIVHKLIESIPLVLLSSVDCTLLWLSLSLTVLTLVAASSARSGSLVVVICELVTCDFSLVQHLPLLSLEIQPRMLASHQAYNFEWTDITSLCCPSYH